MLPALFLHHLRRRLLCSSSTTTTSLNPNPNPDSSSVFSASSKPLRSLLKPIVRQRDPDTLVSLFNLASADRRIRLHPPIYSLVVRRLSLLNRPDAVRSLLEHQKSHPEFHTSEPFAARLILLYGRARLFPDALSTFHSLPCPRSSLSINSLLSSAARSGLPPPDIAALIQDIQSSFPDIAPTVVTYNIIVSALCERRDFDQAMDTLDLMRNKGFASNVITYNTLLHGLYNSKRFDAADEIWEQMEEKDVRSYNSRLRGLVAQKRIVDALKVFDEMKAVGVKPDTFSFNALIKGYCRNGMLEEAKKVYLGLEEEECKPDMQTFQTLIPVVWEAKEYDFAVRLCNESVNIGCYLDVELLQKVVNGLAKEEMYSKAKKLVNHVRSKNFYGSKCLRVPLTCLAI